MHWGVVYGLAALFVALFSRTGPRRNVRLVSLVLLLNWLLFNLIDHGMPNLSDAVQFSALMDAVSASLALNMCLQRPRRWKIALALCFAGQLVTHVAIMFLPESEGSKYQYKLILNLLFAGELISVAVPTFSFHMRQLGNRWARRAPKGRGRLTVAAGNLTAG
jgi:peptidoglycan/LPS O-acetylase OafA/YrhL